METQLVMDRKKVADSIHSILETGINLINKEKLTPDDHSKIKAIRVMGSHVNAAVAMVQQETAQQRVEIVRQRMAQLGYNDQKTITE